MDQHKIIHISCVILDTELLLNQPINRIKVIQRKPLAGLIPKRQAFASISVMTVDDHVKKILYVLIRKIRKFCLQDIMIDAVKVLADVTFQEISFCSMLAIELVQKL